jgi:hypothetical protein
VLPVCVSDGKIHLAWIDQRHRKREWWSYVPGHQMVTWDADPEWANNDLYYTSFNSVDLWQEPRRLTPPLSYVREHQYAVAMATGSDSILILWSGKRKVGKTVDQSNLQEEVFFTALNLAD